MHSSSTTSLALTLFIFLAWAMPSAMAAGQADSPTSGTASNGDIRQALDEMGQLEKQLETHQSRLKQDEQDLDQKSRSLQSVRQSLDQHKRMKEEGGKFFQLQAQSAKEKMLELDRLLGLERTQWKQARRQQYIATGTMAAESSAPAPDPACLLALACMSRQYRDRAAIGSQRILRMETEQASLLDAKQQTGSVARSHTIFTEYGMDQLRDRHAKLARQVAALQTDQSDARKRIDELGKRREELRGLVKRLVDEETRRAEEELAAASAKPKETPAAVTPSPTATPLAPAVSLTADEAPYEQGSEPLVSEGSQAGEGEPVSETGTRFLVWRATPVGVRAMASGKVVYAGPFAGYRHLLIIDHGSNWRTLYGNLTACSVKVDDTVMVGQTVGRYQASQGSRADPLWFEIRQGVEPVLPEKWPALPTDWKNRLIARLDEASAAPAQ